MQRAKKASRAAQSAKTAPAPARQEPKGVSFWREHAAICAITAIAAVLILSNLWGPRLWADEGDTAVLGKSILVNGLPKAWDGVTFTDSDSGKRLNSELVQVVHPWVPFYLAAGSMTVLGESAFAVRLPFALAGILTVPVVYALMRRMGFDRRTACLAAVLLLFSVQFLVYARQARHYSINMLLSCVLVLLATYLDRWAGRIAFGLTAIVLFHCHPLPALAVLAAVGLLVVVRPEFRGYRAGYAMTLPVVLLLTLPWLTLSVVGLKENSAFPIVRGDSVAQQATSYINDVTHRCLQFWSESSELVPWLLWLIVIPIAAMRGSQTMRTFLVVMGTVLAALAAVNIATQSVPHMWDLGVRYACAWIPLGACVTAALVAFVARGRLGVEIALVALVGLTHLPDNTLPWLLFKKEDIVTTEKFGFSMHLPPDETPPTLASILPESLAPGFRIVPKLLRLEVPAFIPELWAANPGVIETVSEYLNRNAKPGELLITNYEWEPLYFHTRLPQALKVMPDYDCYQAARAHNLPEYVFGVEGTRWIVWRPIWESYQGYFLKKVLDQVRAAGGVPQLVADPHDTRWENRENVHFRRFPYAGQLYYVEGLAGRTRVITHRPPWPDAKIYRVEWPQKKAPAGA